MTMSEIFFLAYSLVIAENSKSIFKKQCE